MKSNDLKSKAQKVANVMIIGMVVVGTVIFAVINQVSTGAELMPKLFLLFFGAIITIQVIPSLILLAKMIKGVASIGQKNQESVKESAHNGSDK
ncbi:MAG: hypothetical protein PHY09_05690 [Desulfuromonadaceae bacterium]|nr:hypothetical protein [Desulfuromonadaceae bacterium]MDD5107254.1 hypothetical protein [Desulfuromonadaceae bacterium]